ncbi:MAG TPA: class I SAM-dependent methyltransferase [Thermoplasmata archaeon]|nr:class I SAM-dependent methyltransferase [Thermoplasmata archaeon]
MTRPSPAPSPRREFDREAPNYDRTASASMPGYIDLHRTLLGGIPYVPTREFRVLELGVGTGTLSSLVLEEFPHARLTGVDLSPRMIARARTKLRSFRSRVELIAGDIGDFEESPYDAVISALAIHHLTDPQKWRLFRRVYRCLSPGGYFGDADDHLAEDPTFDNRWAQIASTTAVGRRKRAGGWTSPQAVWHEHERFDHPSTLFAEVAALGRAGFSHVGVPWRFFGQAVVWAYK